MRFSEMQLYNWNNTVQFQDTVNAVSWKSCVYLSGVSGVVCWLHQLFLLIFTIHGLWLQQFDKHNKIVKNTKKTRVTLTYDLEIQ